MAAKTYCQNSDNIVPVLMMKNKMTESVDGTVPYVVVKVEKNNDEINGFEPDVVNIVASTKSSKLNDKEPNVTVYRVPQKSPLELQQDKHTVIKSEKGVNVIDNTANMHVGVTNKKLKLRGTDDVKKCAPGVSLLKHFIELHQKEQTLIKNEMEVTGANKGVKLEDTEGAHIAVTQPAHVSAMTKKYHCDNCDRVYMYSESLRKHINRVHLDIKPYICDICGHRFPAPGRLQAHKKTHTQKQTVACDTCGREIKKCVLKRHMDSHQGTHKSPSESRRHSCTVCEKVFSKPIALKRHMYQHTGEPKPHKCGLCESAFITELELKHHTLLHSDLKEFICEFCSKGFASSFHLKKHRYIHTKEKTLTCETCGKKFSHRSRLLDHEANHSNDKPHICTICNKGFPRMKNLKRHMILHEGRKEHVCSVCGKEFALKDSLKDHQKTHSEEISFCCDLCGKLFPSSRNLKRHKLIHIDELPYECSVCGKRCRYLSNLHKHMRVHDEKNERAKSRRSFNLSMHAKKKPVRTLKLISRKDLISGWENMNKHPQTLKLEENLNASLEEETTEADQSSVSELQAIKLKHMGSSNDDQSISPNQIVNSKSDVPQTSSLFKSSSSFLENEDEDLNNDEVNDHEDNDEIRDDTDDFADEQSSSCSDNDVDNGAPTKTEILQIGNVAKQVTEGVPKFTNSEVEFKLNVDETRAVTKVSDKIPINAAASRKYDLKQNSDFKTEFQQFLSIEKCVDQVDIDDKMHSRYDDEADRKAKLEKSTGSLESTKSDILTNSLSKQKQNVRLLKVGEMFPCRLCSVKFKLYHTLVMHMVHVHDIDEDNIIDEEGFYS